MSKKEKLRGYPEGYMGMESTSNFLFREFLLKFGVLSGTIALMIFVSTKM